MKIITTENNEKKMYIQEKDIHQLYKMKKKLMTIDAPANNLKNTIAKLNGQQSTFIEVRNQHDIKIIEQADWIIGYDELINKPLEILEDNLQLINIYIEKIGREIKFDSRHSKINHQLLSRISILEHQKEDLKEIIAYKKGKKEILIPDLPNLNKEMIVSSNHLYRMNFSIKLNEIIISRADNKIFTDTTKLPENFLKECIAVATCQFLPPFTKIINYQLIPRYSEDKKKVIIKFVIKSNKKKITSFATEKTKLTLKKTSNLIKK